MPSLARNPLAVLEEVGRRHGGEIVRLDLGFSKPYLVTKPDHVQRVWQRSDVYVRGGAMWDSMARFQGNGILGEGPQWQTSRKLIQPLFTGKAISALMATTAESVNQAVDDLAGRVGTGTVVNAHQEMLGITQRVLSRAFLGDRIPQRDAQTLSRAVFTAYGAMGLRLLLPFVSLRVPMPGDRTYDRGVRTIDSILLPNITRARAEEPTPDILSVLAHARDEQGNHLADRLVRDDLVAMFLAGTETTASALTWLWTLREIHPDVAARQDDEIQSVVGGGPVAAEHVGKLTYTKAVLDEVLRLYPAGWFLPRVLQAPDELGGVALKPGSTVIISPYLTHRMPDLWPDPERFDPERFAVDREQPRRHPYAYYPFAGGIHRCLGSHFFVIEALLAAAAMVSRFHHKMRVTQPVLPNASASLRPRGKTSMELRPRG
ncbi:MAG TPA: cytochrome P450 [Planosporangium sp.]|nr:cytochrome P450 [Planosporangium sp.]